MQTGAAIASLSVWENIRQQFTAGDFTAGIVTLLKEDDPTILLFPDAVTLELQIWLLFRHCT